MLDVHPHSWEFGFGDTLSTPNARFDYIKPLVVDANVLDIGVVQHDTEAIDDDAWLHGLIERHADDCMGIDIDEVGIKHLREEGYDVAVADAESFDFEDTFEVIVAGEIIEHVSNVGAFLNRVREHLDDDGVFILTTPNPFFWRRFALILLCGTKPVNPEHTCWFDEITLSQVLTRHGFEIDELHFTSQEWIYRNLPIPRPELRHSGFVAVVRKR